ncbi:cysteine desulfurase family protein [Mediterraneibacter gnavus]|jgi:cysteine desulfurase|uniref:cysteine desulfurase family protein n=1 Tax=Mediterraneibacter gnavus TaxID=33038 RepID=UPI0031B628A5
MSIYLDYNSSAPIDGRVLDVMVDVYKNIIGNADSRTHDYGEGARKIVEHARKQVASILKINKDEVIFTSGATESNNIALQGLKEYAYSTNKKHIITTSIEHKAVLETAKALQKQGFEVDYVSPDLSGRISVKDIMSKVREDTLLVSVMHVNNETGIIQPVYEIGEALQDREVLFHVDATQSFGKLVEELQKIQYNMLSMSAHKLGGPQGIGALILRKQKYKFPPVKAIMYGGQQEHGIRPGTLPVALIAGLGKACEIAEEEYKDNNRRCQAIKDKMKSMLEESGLTYKYNGLQEYAFPTTVNVCFCGVSSEALMLSSKEFCSISNGAACNSKSYNTSYVLLAMGIPEDQIESSVRISWGYDTEMVEFEKSFKNLLESARRLVW